MGYFCFIIEFHRSIDMNTNLHEKVQIKDNIPARGICYSSTNQLVTNHWHNSLELIVITEGIMEVGSGDDTYHLHEKSNRKGCNILDGETTVDYQNKLKTDLEQLQMKLKEKSQIDAPVTFTYPFGYICPEAQKPIEEIGFLASLSCYERINRISKNKGCLYSLGRFNRPEGISTEEFMKKITIQ